MHESLRSSKSIVKFSNEMGRDVFNKSLIKSLCDSGKLLSILERPNDYNLMVVDIAEKCPRCFGAGRADLQATNIKQITKDREERFDGIKSAFPAHVEDVIDNLSLWLHLADLQMMDKITQNEQDV